MPTFVPPALSGCEQARDALLDRAEMLSRAPNSLNVPPLIRAAAKFSSELRKAGYGHVLDKPVAEYARLTGTESEFALARATVTSALKVAAENGWSIRVPPAPPKVHRSWKSLHDALLDSNQPYNGDAALRILALLADSDAILWNLTQAATDAKLALQHAQNLETRAAIQTWIRAIEKLVTAELRDYVHSTHLLCLCENIIFNNSSYKTEESIAELICSDFHRHITDLQQAVPYLFASASQAARSADMPLPVPPNPAVQTGTQHTQKVDAKNGPHGPSDEPPAGYPHGPLTGALLKDLAAAIFHGLNLEADSRNLRKSALIKMNRLGPRSYQVFFRDREHYLNANANFQKLVKDAQTKKQVRRSEGKRAKAKGGIKKDTK